MLTTMLEIEDIEGFGFHESSMDFLIRLLISGQ
jgi:hypothetical protein